MVEGCCVVCGGHRFSEVLRVEKFPLFFGAIPRHKKNLVPSFPLVIGACENCAIVQQTELIEEQRMVEVYEADYYNCPSPSSTGMGRSEIEKFVQFFNSLNLKKGALLEIGCFDGFLLNELRINGWEVFGCDPSPMTEVAVTTIGETYIKRSFFQEGLYDHSSFDVIIFRNLLEHLYDLHGFLDAVRRCLRPGGIALIDVPNIKTLSQLGGFGLFFHQHISYFSLATITPLLQKHGFSVECALEGIPNLFLSAKKSEHVRSDFSFSGNSDVEQTQRLIEGNHRVQRKIDDIFNRSDFQRIAFFGASVLATTVINYLPPDKIAKIKCILDNDSDKENKVLYGCDAEIRSIEGFDHNEVDCILISTYFFDEEIRKQLLKRKIPSSKLMTLHEKN